MTASERARILGLLSLVGLAVVFALGLSIGRTTQELEPYRVYAWALGSAAFGALVGLSEILTRYRDEPITASLTSFGLGYLGLNALVAVAAFALLRAYPGSVFPEQLRSDLFLSSVVAGFGAMTVFRSKLFTYRSADGKEYSIGPAIVLETVLKTIDQKIDRRRATYRQNRVFEGTSALHDFEHAAQYIEATLGSFQNLTPDQKSQIDLVINDFRQSPYPERLKLMGLGFAFLDLAGEENFDVVVGNITNFISSLPIAFVYATNITGASADIVWLTRGPGDSQVEYGVNTTYGSRVPPSPDPAPVVVHQQSLLNLAPRTTYHFRVRSVVDGGLVISADHSFQTR